jgi:hypothetical protein
VRLLRIFLTVLGAILLFWVVVDYVPLLLQIGGETVEGRVTGKNIERTGTEEEADGFYTVHYEFVSAGVPHQGKATVSQTVYQSTEEGAQVPVRIWPNRPGMNLPAGYLGDGVRGLPLLIVGVVLFSIGFFFIKPSAFII